MPKLTRPPHLAPQLAKGALNSPRKRAPYTDVRLPSDPLTLVDAPVDTARLQAYNAVCRFPAGLKSLPPTYPHIMAFPLAMRLMAAADFPFPLLGLIHTGITLSCPVPLPSTARPTLTVHSEGLTPHRKGTAFTVVTSAELDGATVWHSRSTYLCTHRTERPDQNAPRESRNTPLEEPSEAALPNRATWNLPAHLGRRYASSSGDRNPIHLHPLTARLFGFPRPIAHGMWTFARCLAELGELTFAEADFKAPVPLPTAVTFAAADTEGDSGNGVGTAAEPDPTGPTSPTNPTNPTNNADSAGSADSAETETETETETPTRTADAPGAAPTRSSPAVTAFALLSEGPHGGRNRVHLSGRVKRGSSDGPPSGSPGPPSRSS